MKKILTIVLLFPSILFSQSWNLIGPNTSTVGPSSIYGTNINDRCGQALALSSNVERIIVGCPTYNDDGYVRVYQLFNGMWNQVGQDILANSLNPLTWEFGGKVAISGD